MLESGVKETGAPQTAKDILPVEDVIIPARILEEFQSRSQLSFEEATGQLRSRLSKAIRITKHKAVQLRNKPGKFFFQDSQDTDLVFVVRQNSKNRKRKCYILAGVL